MKQNEKKTKDEELDSNLVKEKEINETEVSDEENNEPSEIDNLKQQVDQADNNYMRALADYQNLQKRVTDERRELIMTANRELLLRILTILDTLELANKHDESEGLKISIRQFLDILKSEGVTKIETVGHEFDPATMEAIATGPGGDGKVLEEIRTGYILNDKLLRAAQVTVGKARD